MMTGIGLSLEDSEVAEAVQMLRRSFMQARGSDTYDDDVGEEFDDDDDGDESDYDSIDDDNDSNYSTTDDSTDEEDDEIMYAHRINEDQDDVDLSVYTFLINKPKVKKFSNFTSDIFL